MAYLEMQAENKRLTAEVKRLSEEIAAKTAEIAAYRAEHCDKCRAGTLTIKRCICLCHSPPFQAERTMTDEAMTADERAALRTVAELIRRNKPFTGAEILAELASEGLHGSEHVYVLVVVNPSTSAAVHVTNTKAPAQVRGEMMETLKYLLSPVRRFVCERGAEK